jgi:hypothetical protein
MGEDIGEEQLEEYAALGKELETAFATLSGGSTADAT